MMIETFECEDNYEAEKLAGLLAVQKDNSIYVSKIAGVIKNEIIIMLKDRSSHSVTLKDENKFVEIKITCGGRNRREKNNFRLYM